MTPSLPVRSPGDAGRVCVRPLGRDDLPLVEEHLLALAPEDRHARFGAGRGDAAGAAYARGLDPSRARLVGGVDDAGGRVVGLAEAHPTELPGAYEIAVSVHPDHRRRGLGRRLAAAAVAAAFAAGAATAEFHYAPGNRAVARLAAALGARFPSPPGRAVIEHHAWAAAAEAPQPTGGAPQRRGGSVRHRLDDALAYAAVAAIAAAGALWLGALWIGEFSFRADSVRGFVRFGLLACGLSVVLVGAAACRSLAGLDPRPPPAGARAGERR